MPPTHEQHRRRRLIRSWIPAALLLVISAAAVTVAVTARVADVGAAPSAAPSNAVTARGTSLFTRAGLRYIADSRRVFIDATARPIQAEPLGLAASGTLTIEPPTEGVYEYLSVVGPGGGTRFMGTSIEIRTRGGLLQSASVADSNRVLSYRNTLELLRERADRYGIPTGDLDAFATAAATAATRGTSYRYSIHTDDALGVALTVTASCSSESVCSVVDVLGFG
jgi:hypothetical protein